MIALRRGALPVAAAFAGIAHLAIVVPGLFYTRLWEDEAYNLTVPLNLLAGLGYSSDGILVGGGPMTFDPRISTGPTVLLPVAGMLSTGIDPVLGARIVMALFYAALVVGLWLLGRRIAGGWGGLIAAVTPLAVNLNRLPSPVQGPTDILGELPAATFLVFSLYLCRNRPLWAGLMLGLAIQTKFIALFAVPAVLLAVLVSVPGQRVSARVLRVAACGLVALIPTAVVELWKLAALGWPGYVSETRQFRDFVLSGGQAGYAVSGRQKVASLADAWFVPWWIVALVVAAALLVALVLWRSSRTSHLVTGLVAWTCRRDGVVLAGGAAIGLICWNGWWLLSAHTPDWIRYAGPALLAFVPVLLALLVRGVQLLWRGGVGSRSLAGVVVTVLVVAVGLQAVLHSVNGWTPNRGETLLQQRQAASAIAAFGATELQSEWGSAVSIAVMAGATSRLTDATDDRSVLQVLTSDATTASARAVDLAAQAERSCSQVLLKLPRYTLCHRT